MVPDQTEILLDDTVLEMRGIAKSFPWVLCKGANFKHAKDDRTDSTLAEANGLIDESRMDGISERPRNYVALGHGHDVRDCRGLFAVARSVGYDGPVSHEMEDIGVGLLTGEKKSPQTLKLALPCDLA